MKSNVQPLKVWFVGGEDINHRIPLVQELCRFGIDVSLVGTRRHQSILDAKIKYYEYEMHRWLNPIHDLRTIVILTRLFKKHKPDVVHAFDTKPAVYAMLAARRSGVKVKVRTITGMGYLFSEDSLFCRVLRPIYRALHKLASGSVDVTVFQNRDDLDYFKKYNLLAKQRNVLVKGSGIDVDCLRAALDIDECSGAVSAIGTRFIMVARLVKQKGVLDYLMAARQIKKKHSQCYFTLVGPADEGKESVPMKAIEEYKDCVTYLGGRSDVPQLMERHDFVVLPTYYREGVPRVLLEAFALGKPVITTKVPGCNELVEDGINGLLIEARNAFELEDAMGRCVNMSQQEVSHMSGNAVKTLDHGYHLSQVAESYADIYNSETAVYG